MLSLCLTGLVSWCKRSEISNGSELAKNSGSLATKLSIAMDADVEADAGVVSSLTAGTGTGTVCGITYCGDGLLSGTEIGGD